MDRTPEKLRNKLHSDISLNFVSEEACSTGKEFNFEPVRRGFKLQYEHINGRLYQGNSLEWLESLDDASVDLVFADPPYNIKKADWDNLSELFSKQKAMWKIF